MDAQIKTHYLSPPILKQLSNHILFTMKTRFSRYLSVSVFFLFFNLLCCQTKAQIINLFAGVGGTAGSTGDGGQATAAKLAYPFRITPDGSGNIYIADMNNAIIRKVDAAGIITAVAGSGVQGYSGDGGPALAARLNNPLAIAFDVTGNMYILDNGSSVIRKVTTAGIITTVAGNGTAGYSGDGGPAVLAMLNHPTDIETDKTGNLYIADGTNHAVRKVTAEGTISAWAGNGANAYTGDSGLATLAGLKHPTGLAVDANGNLYIADDESLVIRKVTPENIISTFAGTGIAGFSGDGGAATSAQFQLNSPNGLAVDNNGNVYAADYQNHAVRKINTNGIISTVAGTSGVQGTSGDGGPATSAKLWFPVDVTVDGYNLYITSPYNNNIRKVTFPSPVLPLQYLKLSASVENAKTIIRWQTVNERDADFFEVQRNDSINTFKTIGYVKATAGYASASAYQYIDSFPHRGPNSYRLKQVNKDKRFNFSTILYVLFNDRNTSVFPNPAGSSIFIQSPAKIQQIRLTDVSGRNIKSFRPNASNRYSLEDVPNGLYFMTIDYGNLTESFPLMRNNR